MLVSALRPATCMVTRLDRASRSTRDFLNTLAMIAILHSYGWSSSCFIAIKVKGEMTGRETAKVACTLAWRFPGPSQRDAREQSLPSDLRGVGRARHSRGACGLC